mmetsp:Transcript_3041/g.8583  ORF Transcript_3041/g.8583 Transcript_3041/m.8583 type:complete len:236 (-) Transcript_3041:3-710(-)
MQVVQSGGRLDEQAHGARLVQAARASGAHHRAQTAAGDVLQHQRHTRRRLHDVQGDDNVGMLQPAEEIELPLRQGRLARIRAAHGLDDDPPVVVESSRTVDHTGRAAANPIKVGKVLGHALTPEMIWRMGPDSIGQLNGRTCQLHLPSTLSSYRRHARQGHIGKRCPAPPQGRSARHAGLVGGRLRKHDALLLLGFGEACPTDHRNGPATGVHCPRAACVHTPMPLPSALRAQMA